MSETIATTHLAGTPINLLMVGLQGSGKTTFLAGLFHTLNNASENSLSLRDLPEEREYLLTLERRWLDLEEIQHSALAGPQRVELPIRDANGRLLDLILPDVSGEEYRDAWESGGFSAMIADLLRVATGLLFFIHAGDVNEPKLLDVRGTPAAAKPETWRPRMAVTQAKLCDLLEQIVEVREGTLPPIAIVLSAWDTVSEDITPDAWLPWRLPLLAQWLEATDIVFPHTLFGISAQGGDLSDPDARRRLAAAPRIGRPGGSHSLIAPLEWLLAAQ